jgi:hypothetical protein
VSCYFFKKNKCCSIFARNAVPHYFFRNKASASLFLQKKCRFVSEEIMRHFIFSEKNNEALYFFIVEVTLA